VQDFQQTVISQYANSPRILALISSFNAAVDPSANIDAFYNNVWNIETAQGYGLDVLGRIVGVSRIVTLTASGFLGLKGPDGTASGVPFGAGPFYDGSAITSNYALNDASFRTLILAKAYSNICNGSIIAINQILLTIFEGLGDCYCTDGRNMTMTFTFTFKLTNVQQAIVLQTGVLPRPCGVSFTIVQPT
jgi:hypothetical protein